MEFNAVAVYYLRKILKQENVTLDHVFTCYGEVTRRPPEAFRQSFTDTKTNKVGWSLTKVVICKSRTEAQFLLNMTCRARKRRLERIYDNS